MKLRSINVISALLLVSMSMLAQKVSTVVTCPGEDASSSMRISWAADAKGSSVRYYAANAENKAITIRPETEFRCTTFDGVGSKAPNNDDIVEHVVFTKCGATLKSLRSDTEYCYTICDSQGKAVTDVHRFRTAGAKQWSCCVISDFHSYTPLQRRLDDAMRMHKTVEDFGGGVDWTLHLGDVTAWGASWSFWKKLYSEPVFSRMMWAGCVGNHDYMANKFLRLSNEFFHQANYMPENGYRGEMGVCYHFRYGDVMFVMLNNESMHNEAGLATAQSWVRKVVTEARQIKNAPRYVVVCEHYQWFIGVDGATSQYGRWCKVFDELGVDLALAGNNHIYARTDAVYDGKTTDGSRGTVYLQTSSSDNERGRKMNKELKYNADLIKFRWTEGPKTISALYMNVDENRIALTLLDRNGKVLDTVNVLAKKR